MEKTGDFAEAVGNIMERSMRTTADTTLTASERVAQFRAEIENTKVALGEELLPVADATNKFILMLGKGVSAFFKSSVADIEGYPGLNEIIAELEASATKKPAENPFAYLFDPVVKFLNESKTIQKLQSELKVLQDTLIKLPIGSKAFIDTQKEIKKVQEELRLALGGTSGELDKLNKKTLNLSESLDKLPKLVSDAYDPFREATTLMDKFREAAEGIVDTNLDEFYLRLGIAISEADDANIEFFKSILDGQADEALNKQREIAAFYDIAGSSIDFFSTMSSQATERYLQDLQKQLDAGKITQEQFDRERKKALREQAKDTRALAVFDIVLNTARSVMSFLAQTPPNVPGSIAAGVAGALQLSTAITQPLPAFATGTVDLKGEGTETSDSIVARLSKGESVITAKGTKQDKALFEAANKLQLEDYINKNYVLPALVKVQKDKADMFDDYRLYMSLQNMKKSDKENTDKIVRAIKTEYTNNRRYWA